MLVCELLKGLYDDPGVGAVIHEDGGGAHPRLQVVEAEGDVLGVVPVEDPDLPVGRGLWHPVPVVVEEHPLLPRVPAQAGGQSTDLLQRRVQTQLVPRPGLPPLVLLLQVVPDLLDGPLRVERGGIDPALRARARLRLGHIRRVHAHVQADHQCNGYRLHALAHAPRLLFLLTTCGEIMIAQIYYNEKSAILRVNSPTISSSCLRPLKASGIALSSAAASKSLFSVTSSASSASEPTWSWRNSSSRSTEASSTVGWTGNTLGNQLRLLTSLREGDEDRLEWRFDEEKGEERREEDAGWMRPSPLADDLDVLSILAFFNDALQPPWRVEMKVTASPSSSR